MALAKFETTHELDSHFEDFRFVVGEAEHVGGLGGCHFVDRVHGVDNVFVVDLLPLIVLLPEEIDSVCLQIHGFSSEGISLVEIWVVGEILR